MSDTRMYVYQDRRYMGTMTAEGGTYIFVPNDDYRRQFGSDMERLIARSRNGLLTAMILHGLGRARIYHQPLT